MTLHQLQD